MRLFAYYGMAFISLCVVIGAHPVSLNARQVTLATGPGPLTSTNAVDTLQDFAEEVYQDVEDAERAAAEQDESHGQSLDS